MPPFSAPPSPQTSYPHLVASYPVFGLGRRRNGQSASAGRVYESEHHNLQEYTYKKITPCDVCSQVLRGKYAQMFASCETHILPIVNTPSAPRCDDIGGVHCANTSALQCNTPSRHMSDRTSHDMHARTVSTQTHTQIVTYMYTRIQPTHTHSHKSHIPTTNVCIFITQITRNACGQRFGRPTPARLRIYFRACSHANLYCSVPHMQGTRARAYDAASAS